MCAPQNAGSGLNGAVSFGLKAKSNWAQNKNADGVRNDPWFTNQKQVSRHDAVRSACHQPRLRSCNRNRAPCSSTNDYLKTGTPTATS
jgi:hypothetical protein